MHLSLAQLLSEAARRRPARTALVDGGDRLTYATLWRRASGYARLLAARGVRRGDRVAVMLPNTADFPAIYYAVLALGATVVPVNLLLTPEEIAYIVRDTDAVMLIAAESVRDQARAATRLTGTPLSFTSAQNVTPAERLDVPRGGEALAAPVQVDAGDIAVVLYTSGTTGRPKGAMLTHGNLVLNAVITARDVLDLRTDDVVLGCLPLFHSFGQTVVMNAACCAGAAVVLMKHFEGAAAIDVIDREGVTVFAGVPTMYIGLLAAARADPRRPRLRLAVSGGAALPVAVLERFAEVFGAPVHEGYGLSETSPVATFSQPVHGRRPGSIGHPIWGLDVEIARAGVEDRIDLLGTGEVGEIVIRGHAVFAGYLNDPEATARSIVDGWFRTGDLGTKDAEGFIRVVDRKKDMIVRGGYNVYPREVEETLARHPAVAQVAVVGLPDDHYGEEVHAVVVPSADAPVTASAIIEWSREHLARYKYPRQVHFVEEFPLGPSGKVLKRELVTRLTSRHDHS